jgi:hypothetical protein
LGLLNRFERQLLTCRIHIRVVVGADRQRNAPQRHRRSGIEFRGTLKGPCRFFMVKAINQSDALVEKFLSLLAFCVNRMVLPAYNGNREVDRLCFLVFVLRGSDGGEHQHE